MAAGEAGGRRLGVLARLVLVMSVALLVPSALVMTTALAQLALNVLVLPGRSNGVDALGQAIGEAILTLLVAFAISIAWLITLVFLLWRGRRPSRWLLAVTLLAVAVVAIEYALIDHRQYDLHQSADGPVRPDYHSVHVPNPLLALADVALALVLVTPAVGRDFRRHPRAAAGRD
jgi:uncharacterized membrane protein YozB (DUF420 family)